jgi:hypothetical protein
MIVVKCISFIGSALNALFWLFLTVKFCLLPYISDIYISDVPLIEEYKDCMVYQLTFIKSMFIKSVKYRLQNNTIYRTNVPYKTLCFSPLYLLNVAWFVNNDIRWDYISFLNESNCYVYCIIFCQATANLDHPNFLIA